MIRLVILAIVAGGSFVFNAFQGSVDNPEKEKVIQNTVLTVLEQAHFSPADLTDEFSSRAFDDFINALDGRKRFFTQDDIASLEVHRLQLDDQANQGSLDFFESTIEIFDRRLSQVGDMYKEMLADPIDFTAIEEIELDPDKREYPTDEQELRDTWRKYLKYDVLNQLESKIASQEKRSETDGEKSKEIKTTAQLEIEARDDVKEKFDEWFKNMGKLKRSDRFEVYLNTFSHLFDPHSDYYNPKERQDFDIGMSGKLEGIGARLRSEGDLTMVASIVPGGPAWTQGDIEVNDYILSVTQQNEETVDIFGMRLDDVVSMIRGDKGTIVTLAIQKKDGTVIQVEIERDVVNIEDSFARSAIIDLEGKAENIGYIHLPKFYSSFEAPNEGNSCAVDVAEEIEKLKTNKVNGIILDLRNNGGGSLKDVVDMSGLFIEDGPIVQVKPRDRKAFVYKDDDAEVKYNGPLVVLINSFSASASEILAAAMQDYDRAIVVGTQSFGKGTVQRFIDLDRAVRGTSEHKPLGAVKVTMQKFYRIDGGSTQLRGVTPDIELPDRYSLIDVGEREYPYALDWTEIAGLEYNQDVFNIDAAQKVYLKAQSSKRLSTNPDFQLIQEQAKWLKENREQTSYALNLDQFIAQVDAQEAEAEQFKVIMDEAIAEMSIKTLPEDEEAINFDETTKGRSENWVSVRSKDIYIQEAMSIIGDLIAATSYTNVNSDPDTNE